MVKKVVWRKFCILFFLSISSHFIFSQDIPGIKNIISLDHQKNPKYISTGYEDTITLRDTGGTIAGVEYIRNKQHYIRTDKAEFPVINTPYTYVSMDKRVILKYGQIGAIHHESITDLYWYDLGGEYIKAITGKYQRLEVCMSVDGYVAITGREIKGKTNMITVFNPRGTEVMRMISLGDGEYCSTLRLSAGGKNIIVLMGDDKRNSDTTQSLVLFLPDGRRKVIEKGITYAQGLFLSHDGNYVLAPWKNKTVLFNLANGEKVWTIPQFVRVLRDSSFEINTMQNLVILNTVNITGDNESAYSLLFLSLDMGDILLEKVIPEITLSAGIQTFLTGINVLQIEWGDMVYQYRVVRK